MSRLEFVITVGWMMGVYEFTISPPKESAFAYFTIRFRARDKLGNSWFLRPDFSFSFSKRPKVHHLGYFPSYISHASPSSRIILLLEQRLIPESEPLSVGVSASFYLPSHTSNETFFGIVKLYWLFWALEGEEKSLMAFMLTASGFLWRKFSIHLNIRRFFYFPSSCRRNRTDLHISALSGSFVLSKLPWKYRQANNHRSCLMWINVFICFGSDA